MTSKSRRSRSFSMGIAAKKASVSSFVMKEKGRFGAKGIGDGCSWCFSGAPIITFILVFVNSRTAVGWKMLSPLCACGRAL